ncbi:hypothetical protein B0A52_02408 [Exophiala mesophila]|uniref:Uncharacterized protein n=1 Tax=Exophiala mesophila TaxID=212818 RepID=A0A438NCL5_EXOME|nr:hypothetical protein B0A52_02408 [Exophiala mesophila]
MAKQIDIVLEWVQGESNQRSQELDSKPGLDHDQDFQLHSNDPYWSLHDSIRNPLTEEWFSQQIINLDCQELGDSWPGSVSETMYHPFFGGFMHHHDHAWFTYI